MISNRWKIILATLPIIGTLALAQPQPGGLGGFFSAWWGAIITTFEPMDIEGMEWWIDASDAESISLQAGTNLVSQWNDKSGNDKHLTQATSGLRPKWKENEKNGLAVVRFDGAQVMSVPSSTNLFNFLHQSNTTWFAVAKFGDVQLPTGNHFLFDNTGFAAGPGMAFAYRQSFTTITNTWQLRVNRGILSYVVQNHQTNSGRGGQYILLTHVADLTAAAIDRSKLYYDGSLLQNNDQTNAVTTANAYDNFTIGDVSVAGPQRLTGEICEIIIYSGILPDNQISLVQNYLATKWGLQ